MFLPIFFAVCCPLATQGPPGQSACRIAWRRGPKKVKDANQCRTHSLVESEKVLSLAPNHGVRLPNGSSSNPVYGISPGILIQAMRINHDMCVFAHIHSLPLGVPSSPSFNAAPGFRLFLESKTGRSVERALSAPRAPTKRPRARLPQPLRSKSVSAYSLPSTTGSPEKGCSWSSRARSSTRRILPEIVFGSSANSRRRMRLYGARFSRQ